MASQMPPEGGPTPAQIEQIKAAIAAEAARQGITPEEFQARQRAAIDAEAKKLNMTPQEYIQKMRAEAIANARMQAQQQQQNPQQQQQQQQQQQAVPINNGGKVDPRAAAVLQWLRGQNLKTRTVILNGQRKDMFRGVYLHFYSSDGPLVGSIGGRKRKGQKQKLTNFDYSETSPSRHCISRVY
jgi:translocation protein SEC62